MSSWKTIDTAPKDGSEIITAKRAEWVKAFDHFSYPITSRFMDGVWKAKFKDGWSVYDPQPSHWLPPKPNA